MNKNCTNCKHAKFERFPESGRRILTMGKCTIEIIVPHSFADYRGDLPQRRTISKHTRSDCPLWERG